METKTSAIFCELQEAIGDTGAASSSEERCAMTPYLLVSGIAYWCGVFTAFGRRMSLLGWVGLGLFSVFLCGFIGLRYEVGKDWYQYNYIFDLIGDLPAGEALIFTDFGYGLLNKISFELGFGISGVFLVCGAILTTGIVAIAVKTPYPWIAVAAAMPHIVTVMAMDHVRQATALGFILLGLARLADGRLRAFFICILLAALFHRSAVLVLGLGIVLITKNRLLIYPAFIAIAGVIMQHMLSDRLEIYSARYLETAAGSRGALIRLVLNAIPALGLLLIRHRIPNDQKFRKVMVLMALGALMCLVLMPLTPSTVIIDRLGKYFLPASIMFFSLIITIFQTFLIRAIVASMIVAYLAFTQIFWLSNSELAKYFWIPYQSLIF